MANHDIHFDIESHRIGFAESTCNYTRLVTPLHSAHTYSIDSANSAAHGSTTASILQLQSTPTHMFTLYTVWRPAAFLLFAIVAIRILHLLFIRHKAATISTNATYGTEPVASIRHGRRRRQPQQPDQPILHRIRMVARSISRDRTEFINGMSQPPGSLSSSSCSFSTTYNQSPARRHQSFTENHVPKKSSQPTSDGEDTAATHPIAEARIGKENCSTTTREVRRGTNILRSRSYQISFREGY